MKPNIKIVSCLLIFLVLRVKCVFKFLKLAVFQMYVIYFMGENASLYETILVYEETIYKYFPRKIRSIHICIFC